MSTASGGTMRAAVTRRWEQIEIDAVPIPEPGPGQVRIRTSLAGICGSDVHIYQGHHPTAAAPVIQGHEFVGVLECVGPQTEAPAEPGDRVVVEPLIRCGQCEACRRGLFHVCRRLKLLGIHEHGAFAERLLAPAGEIIAVPPGLPERLAALTEPFAVGVHVCARAGLEPGARALVIGAGPIGLIVATVARASGAEVVLSEISDARLAQARELGFEAIDGRLQPATQIEAMTDGDGCDVVFEVSGAEGGLTLAIEAARVQATIVQVGFFAKPPEADLFKGTLKELAWRGSRVYRHEDFRRAVRMLEQIHRDKTIDLERLISEQVDLDGIESAIHRMIDGEVSGKVLVDPTKA